MDHSTSTTTSCGDDNSVVTQAPNAPVTAQRKLNIDLQSQLPKPYLPRALVAADPDHPNGTEGRDHHNMSVLQQHVSFFDRNKDGIVYPWETYQGFRAIGCGIPLSLAAAFIINFAFAIQTKKGWLPSPLLPIYIIDIHKCKHGSDSESYDTEGRFEPSKFDAIFSKYGVTRHNALTLEELNNMLRANHNAGDFLGRGAAWAEWRLLFSLGKDEEGFLHRETIRGLYDGSLFEQLEKRRTTHSKST